MTEEVKSEEVVRRRSKYKMLVRLGKLMTMWRWG